MCGDSLVRGKSGSAPGAWAAVVAPTADKVIECDGRAGHGHGRVKWTEARVVLREAEQGYNEKQRGNVNLFHAKMHETLKGPLISYNNALNPPTARPKEATPLPQIPWMAAGAKGLHFVQFLRRLLRQ